MSRGRVRAAFVIAGVSLAAYPMLRPYGPEVGLEGARDFGSPWWVAAHLLGIVGFAAIAFGLRAAVAGGVSWGGRPLREVETRAWVAVVLLLPYYGAEAYGLSAVGRHAVDTGDPSVLAVADSFRYAPVEMTTFALGLVVLAAVGLRVVLGLWHQRGAVRAGALLTAAGLMTFLPQFFGSPEVRIAHGVVLGLGLVLVGLGLAREERSDLPGAHPDALVGGLQPLERTR